MQPNVNLFFVLNLLGAAQALLIAFALVSIKRGNRTANTILAAFAATASILITWTVLNSAGYFRLFPHLRRLNHPFDFTVGPLIFLYVRALTSKRPEFKKSDLLHFIPFGLCIIYLLPFYFQSRGYKLNPANAPADMQWYYVRSSLVILQVLVYLALAGLLIIRYLRESREKKSTVARASLFHVKFLACSVLALWFVAVGRYLFDVRYPAYMRYTNLILPFGATVLIYAMAYLSLRHSGNLAGADNPAPAEGETSVQPARKYEKSTLTSERADAYLKRLLIIMETEQPYTNGDLTLPKLAARLSIATHHLSQIINERLNQNFFDFVNSYRVNEAKRQLLDPAKKHYSLLAIAEEVGFNSKSAFNAAFKKQTNMTPSEFRKASKASNDNVPL